MDNESESNRNLIARGQQSPPVQVAKEVALGGKSEKSQQTRDISPASRSLLEKDPRETHMWHYTFDPPTEVP